MRLLKLPIIILVVALIGLMVYNISSSDVTSNEPDDNENKELFTNSDDNNKDIKGDLRELNNELKEKNKQKHNEIVDKMIKEVGVIASSISLTGNMVIGKLEVELGITEENLEKAKKLAEKELSDLYPDRETIVEIIRNDEQIVAEETVKYSYEFDKSFPGLGKGTLIVNLDTEDKAQYSIKVKDQELQFMDDLSIFWIQLPIDSFSSSDIEIIKR